MKGIKYIAVLAAAAFISACGNAGTQTVQNTNKPAATPAATDKLQPTTAHSTENQPVKLPAANTNSNSGARPAAGGRPIDTAMFDGLIKMGEEKVKAKPDDADAKKTLAQAYFDRGFALTEAQQYASALGDYRRALKLDPTHEESTKWIDQITGIYKMMKKEAPKEGEEPPPLPFKK